jgi:BlaI family transcriptional regulator, penicillinase repressor
MDESTELTDLQLAVLRVLWRGGEPTVQQIQAALHPERPLAVTTVATLLSRLEKRGVVAHRSEGRVYRYRACLSEEEARRSMVGGLAGRLFGGDVTALVSHLLGGEQVGAEELARIREMIDRRERELKEARND